MKNIPDSLKIYELSRIWKEAAYNFAFWDKVDIDWDAEYRKALDRVLATDNAYDYYRELKRFLALLNDGHTDVALPGEIYNDPEYYSMIPVILGKIGQFVVLQTSEELRDRIPLFSTLVKIDGTDVDEYVRENCLPYFWHANGDACGITAASEIMTGRRGSSAVYTFEKDGKPFEYTPFSGRMKKLSLISNCMRRREFTVRFMYDEIMDDIREESIIPAEKMKAPLLMFTALDDSMWPSYESAKSIMKRLEENRYAYKRIHVTYRHGSHFMLPLELGAEKVFFNERAFKRINRRIRADILERTMSFLEQYWK